ncbi:MAG: peptidoglycan DD-metalloendopeptidase family protein [Methylococcales bacterium]
MTKRLTLAATFLSIGMAPAHAMKSTAPAVPSKHAELKTVQSKILAVDNSIDQLQAQQQDAQQQLAELDKQIGGHAALLKDLKSQISQKSQGIKTTEHSIRIQIDNINQQKQTLKDQVVAAYHSGRHDRLKLLLGNQDPLLSDRLLVYFDYLNKIRVQKVAQIETDVRQLKILQDQQKQEVELLNAAIQTKQTEQKQLAEAKQSRAIILRQLHNELLDDKALLNQLKRNEYALKSLIGELQREPEDKVFEPIADAAQRNERKVNASQAAKLLRKKEQQLKSMETDTSLVEQEAPHAVTISIDKSQTEIDVTDLENNFSQRKGHLSWPVAGKIRAATNSDSIEEKRNGVVIEAPEGNPVRTVAKGKVAFAGWMRGYGMLTIVDHDDDYMTIYAFNQSLYKKVGNQVKAGEIIASVGQSGGQSQVGLYFEIRKKGLPLNPEAWFRK